MPKFEYSYSASTSRGNLYFDRSEPSGRGGCGTPTRSVSAMCAVFRCEDFCRYFHQTSGLIKRPLEIGEHTPDCRFYGYLEPHARNPRLPVLVDQFEFLEWTNDGHLRHSKFVALRENKKAKTTGIRDASGRGRLDMAVPRP